MRESLWDVSRAVEHAGLIRVYPRERLDRPAAFGSRLHRGDELSLRELQERRTWWIARLMLTKRVARSTKVRLWSVVILLMVLMGSGAVFLLMAVLAVLGVIAWVRSGAARERETLLRALSEGACPGCAYVAARDIPGGPNACSECGSPWPLLPPEMPSETAHELR